MSIEIRVPTLGESVTEATVGQWFKKPGDAVKADEPLVELETDKVTVEVPAPASGVLAEIAVQKGQPVAVGSVLGAMREGAAAAAPTSAATPVAPKAAPAAEPAAKPAANGGAATQTEMPPSPAARKALAEHGLAADDVAGSGKRGQVLKEDVAAAAAAPKAAPVAKTAPAAGEMVYVPAQMPVPVQQMRAPSLPADASREARIKMTRLRQTIARRLKDAQNTAAMLTTFNDVDMSAAMKLRNDYKDVFEKRHGVRLGFMSFFVKACIAALKQVPDVNAEIEGQDIIYKNHYDIGVAVGT